MNKYLRQKGLKRARAAINHHIQDLVEEMKQGKSGNLVRYLDYIAQFHCYSFNNIILALAQRPNLTRMAGIKKWNKIGRQVCAGEKGIMILGPIKKRVLKTRDDSKNDEQEEMILKGFRPVHVFDVSQTHGEPLPTVIQASGDAAEILPNLKKAIAYEGIAIEKVRYVPHSPGAEAASLKGRIMIRDSLNEADAFRALVHEYAHEIMHWKDEAQGKIVQETEADAAAYVVCRHFGIRCDTADYLMLYDSSPKILLQRLESIRAVSSQIITNIEAVKESTEDNC